MKFLIAALSIATISAGTLAASLYFENRQLRIELLEAKKEAEMQKVIADHNAFRLQESLQAIENARLLAQEQVKQSTQR